MTYETIRLDVADFIATVTIDRPPVNAQNSKFRDEMTQVFDSFNDRDDVRVVILTGAGNMFSAGADLKERPNRDEAGAYWAHARRVRESANSIRECFKPVICAVNGPALGAGAGIMAACDIIIASENATIGMPEIDIGLAGGAAMLQRLVGNSTGRLMFFTGRRLPAAELYRQGVISAVLPREKLMDEAMSIAREIASKSPTGIRYAKLSYNTTSTMPQRDGYRFEQNATHALSFTEDAQEAQAAFREKRKPNFKGK
jgi:enoyl-CoA hydratase